MYVFLQKSVITVCLAWTWLGVPHWSPGYQPELSSSFRAIPNPVHYDACVYNCSKSGLPPSSYQSFLWKVVFPPSVLCAPGRAAIALALCLLNAHLQDQELFFSLWATSSPCRFVAVASVAKGVHTVLWLKIISCNKFQLHCKAPPVYAFSTTKLRVKNILSILTR